MSKIEPGQVYRSCDPRGGPMIRVTAYTPGNSRAEVVDARDGSPLEPVPVKQLHDSPITATGRRRRAGYVRHHTGYPVNPDLLKGD
ncbi:hypothetical protein [Streptomyces syringium]|uniref:hypothetical protein n=1 Tax=Streptomyces syringium TaxID=76729 RepID=UPI003451BBC9